MRFSIGRLTRLLALYVSIGVAISVLSDEETKEDIPRERFSIGPQAESMAISQAVKVGNIIFISGTTAPGPDFSSQLKAIYMRIQSSLGQFGSSIDDVVRETIYTTDLKALESHAALRKFYFREDAFPASTWVEVKALSPDGSFLEIEVVAVSND